MDDEESLFRGIDRSRFFFETERSGSGWLEKNGLQKKNGGDFFVELNKAGIAFKSSKKLSNLILKKKRVT